MKTAHLGGSAASIEVGKIGLGLMMMTWKANPVADEQCFETMKAAIDAGCDFLNSSEFYGISPRTANLELIARFLKKYPEYSNRFFLSVKGGTNAEDLVPNSSEENIRRSVDASLAALGGRKIELFQCARVDPNVPIEKTMEIMSKLVQEGKFDHIGVSETSAATLRRAAKVANVAAVEIEVSPWSYEDETKKVIEAAYELGIAVIAYSPLGRGFLTGQIKSKDQLDDGDFRKHHERFSDENWANNMKLADAFKSIADKKGITPAQLCIAWVASLGPHMIPLPGSSHPKRALENIAAGDIELSPEELTEIYKVMEENPVKGGRYSGAGAKLTWG